MSTESTIGQNTNMSTSSSRLGMGRKRKKIIAGVVTVLGVLILIGLFAPPLVPTYKTSDLVTQTTDTASYSRPRQWQDATYVEKFKKDFGVTNNAVIYGDKVVKLKDGTYDILNGFLVFGEASGTEPTDISVVKTPEFRTALEQNLDKSLTAENFKMSDCQSVNDYKRNYNYDYIGFPVSIAMQLNCRLTPDAQKTYHANALNIHMAMIIANNGKMYLYALVATDKSWEKNQSVYFQMMRDLHGV